MNGNSLGTERVLSVVSYIASGCQRTLLRPGSTLQKWKGAGTHTLRPRDPGTLAGKRSSGGEGGTVHPPPSHHHGWHTLHPGTAASPGGMCPQRLQFLRRPCGEPSAGDAHSSSLCWTVSYCSLLSSAAGGGILGRSFLQSKAR